MFQGMEYIYAVYKEGSFTKAAAKMFISQPSLSANVKRIEKRIGYPIFDRSSKRLKLTECGERYMEAAESIMNIEKNFADYVRDWGELKTGTLTVGGSNFFSSWILPSLLADFSEKYPNIQISLIEESAGKLADMLQKGEVDLVLDNGIFDGHIFDCKIYQEEELLLAVPKKFSVNEMLGKYQIPVKRMQAGGFLDEDISAVPIEFFSDLPFIMMKLDCDTGKRGHYICQENHVNPKVLFVLDQQMTAYNIACSGMGITFVGDMLLEKVPENPNMVFYRLPGSVAKRFISFYWKRGRYLNPVMREFLSMVN